MQYPFKTADRFRGNGLKNKCRKHTGAFGLTFVPKRRVCFYFRTDLRTSTDTQNVFVSICIATSQRTAVRVLASTVGLEKQPTGSNNACEYSCDTGVEEYTRVFHCFFCLALPRSTATQKTRMLALDFCFSPCGEITVNNQRAFRDNCRRHKNKTQS